MAQYRHRQFLHMESLFIDHGGRKRKRRQSHRDGGEARSRSRPRRRRAEAARRAIDRFDLEACAAAEGSAAAAVDLPSRCGGCHSGGCGRCARIGLCDLVRGINS